MLVKLHANNSPLLSRKKKNNSPTNHLPIPRQPEVPWRIPFSLPRQRPNVRLVWRTLQSQCRLLIGSYTRRKKFRNYVLHMMEIEIQPQIKLWSPFNTGRNFSRQQKKQQLDWLATNNDDIITQSHSRLAWSRLVENGLHTGRYSTTFRNENAVAYDLIGL